MSHRNPIIKKIFCSQLRVNMFSGVVTTVVNAGALAVAYPVYLHFLGYETYGVWLILATVLTFAQLGDLGINSAVMKLVAEEYERGNIKAIESYLRTALTMLLFSGTLALILILLLRSHIISVFKLSGQNAGIASHLLPYIAALSVFVMLVQALNSAISGLGRMDVANAILAGGRLAGVVASVTLLSLGIGIESLLIANVLCYSLVGAISAFCIRKTINIRLIRVTNLDNRSIRKLIHFGGGVFAGSLANMLLSPFNKLMLSRYAGVSTVPVYEIAYTGSMQIRALFERSLQALMPEISRIGANMTEYARNRLSQINRGAMRLILLSGIPTYGILGIFAPVLLRIWLGDRFVNTLPGVFRIMLIGTFSNLLCVPAYYTLLGLGRVRYCLVSHVVQGTVNAGSLGMITLLMGTVSVYAVALAVISSMVLTSFYLIWQNRRALPILPLHTINCSPQPFSCVMLSSSSGTRLSEKSEATIL